MHPIIHQNNFSILPGVYFKRIVSLVPSQTELLSYLGLEERVVGITKFCVHPIEWLQTKARIGGTKDVNFDKIKELKPDLIIANKEENVKVQIEELAHICPIYVSDVTDLSTALGMILQIGILVNAKLQSELLVEHLVTLFDQLQVQVRHNFTTAYLIWKNPYMAAGGDTFISDMLQRCGLQNIFGHFARYPQITIHDLQEIKCELLLLSSEPYPFKQKHIDELKAQLPGTEIMLVDGEMFSWYGSRLLNAPAYFRQLLQQL